MADDLSKDGEGLAGDVENTLGAFFKPHEGQESSGGASSPGGAGSSPQAPKSGAATPGATPRQGGSSGRSAPTQPPSSSRTPGARTPDAAPAESPASALDRSPMDGGAPLAQQGGSSRRPQKRTSSKEDAPNDDTPEEAAKQDESLSEDEREAQVQQEYGDALESRAGEQAAHQAEIEEALEGQEPDATAPMDAAITPDGPIPTENPQEVEDAYAEAMEHGRDGADDYRAAMEEANPLQGQGDTPEADDSRELERARERAQMQREFGFTPEQAAENQRLGDEQSKSWQDMLAAKNRAKSLQEQASRESLGPGGVAGNLADGAGRAGSTLAEGAEKAGEAGLAAGQLAAKGGEAAGEGLKDVGRGTEALSTGAQAAGAGVQGAGDVVGGAVAATGVGAPVGAAIAGAGNVAGGALEGAGTAGKVVGKAEEVGGSALKAGSKAADRGMGAARQRLIKAGRGKSLARRGIGSILNAGRGRGGEDGGETHGGEDYEKTNEAIRKGAKAAKFAAKTGSCLITLLWMVPFLVPVVLLGVILFLFLITGTLGGDVRPGDSTQAGTPVAADDPLGGMAPQGALRPGLAPLATAADPERTGLTTELLGILEACGERFTVSVTHGVGGAPNTAHHEGRAVDLSTKGVDPAEMRNLTACLHAQASACLEDLYGPDPTVCVAAPRDGITCEELRKSQVLSSGGDIHVAVKRDCANPKTPVG